MNEWVVGRQGWRYVLVSRTYSRPEFDQYRLAKRQGRVMRFWTRKGAQRMADSLARGIRLKPLLSSKLKAKFWKGAYLLYCFASRLRGKKGD